MAHIVILGSGGFGVALAVTACSCGHQVSVWSPFAPEIETLRADREHKKLLPGIAIQPEIELGTDIAVAAKADLLLFAVPSHAIRQTAQRVAGHIAPHCTIASVAKGVEDESFLRLSQVIEQELPQNPVVVLSGPSHAEEVARGVPTSLVAASKSGQAAEYVQELLMGPNLRIYLNDDLVGVELGGALKNVIALAAGISDGMGLGDNTKAALMTRGLSEIARLGVKMGGRIDTFAGLTGVGDLIVTCTSMHSRNRRCGLLIGAGTPAEQAVQEIGMTVEGYRSTLVAYHLSQKMGVEMPITEQMYRVLYEGEDCKKAIANLMTRPKKDETEQVWFH